MSYNVLRQFVGAGKGGVGVLVLLTFGGGGGGGVMQNRESPDFRSPGLAGMYYLPTSIDFERRNEKEPPFQQVL